MKHIFRNPYQKRQKQVLNLYLIGDEGVSKDLIYQHLQIQRQSQSQQIGISIKQISQTNFIQIYDFPTDKMLRIALGIYFKILPNPSLIIYFLKQDSNAREISQWIGVLKQNYLNQKVVFISDVDTYLQRQKVITKIGKQFEYNILQNICFASLDPTSMQKLFANIALLGIKISSAVCLKPTFGQKVMEQCQKLLCKIKGFVVNLTKKEVYQSVV